jgi:hypothetical protein
MEGTKQEEKKMTYSINGIKDSLLRGQQRFGEYKVKIQSTRHDQYFAEVTSPKYNFIIANYHPQSGLNLWSDSTFTGTLNQIIEKTAFYLAYELSN